MIQHVPRRLAPLLCLLVCLTTASAAFAQEADARAGRVKIAAYNAEFFFDVFDDPYTPDEQFHVKQQPEVAAIAAALREMDADVVCFQELENEELLRGLAGEYLADMGYRYIVCGRTNSGLGQNLGVMSRLPIRKVASYRFRDFSIEGEPGTWRFARDLMQVTLAVPTGGEAADAGNAGEEGEVATLHVFVAHFKSKRAGEGDPESVKWRTAEATGARSIIAELLANEPDAMATLVGDLNDTPDSRPLGVLLGGTELIDVMAASLEQGQERPKTFFSRSRRYDPDTIDYILATPALARRVVTGSVGVLDDERFHEGSDHRPVYATFDLRVGDASP